MRATTAASTTLTPTPCRSQDAVTQATTLTSRSAGSGRSWGSDRSAGSGSVLLPGTCRAVGSSLRVGLRWVTARLPRVDPETVVEFRRPAVLETVEARGDVIDLAGVVIDRIGE